MPTERVNAALLVSVLKKVPVSRVRVDYIDSESVRGEYTVPGPADGLGGGVRVPFRLYRSDFIRAGL